MTASQKPKTPTMTLPVTSSMSFSEIDTFCKKASRLTLSQIVDNAVVEETLTMVDANRRRNFRVTINLFPRDQYEPEYQTLPREILDAFGAVFGIILKKEILVELKKFNADLKAQISNVGKGQVASRERGAAVGEDDDEDAEGADDEEGAADGKIAGAAGEELPPRDDASEVGDGDAEEEKRIRQTRQMSYESDSEDDDTAPGNNGVEDDAVESEVAPDEADDVSMDAATLAGAKWDERVEVAGKGLSDKCGYVVPGSFSFEQKSRSRFKFDLNVRILILAESRLCTKALDILITVCSRNTKASASRHHRTKLHQDHRPPYPEHLALPACERR